MNNSMNFVIMANLRICVEITKLHQFVFIETGEQHG